MVLHNNKWDRKQNRDRIRKLRAKGKDDPAAPTATTNGKDKGSPSKSDVSVPPSTASTTTTEATAGGGGGGGGVEQQSDDDASSSCGEAGDNGGFSRRKLSSNAWRYQEAEEELECPDLPPEDQPPEEDYVALTLRAADQVPDAERDEREQLRCGALDATFLNESWQMQPGQGGIGSKGVVKKVDKKDFVDIAEKVAKQKAVDSFRARFEAPRSASSRVPKAVLVGKQSGHYSAATADDDNLDAFLGELNLDHDNRPVTRPQAPKSNAPLRQVADDDAWLDQMLGGR